MDLNLHKNNTTRSSRINGASIKISGEVELGGTGRERPLTKGEEKWAEDEITSRLESRKEEAEQSGLARRDSTRSVMHDYLLHAINITSPKAPSAVSSIVFPPLPLLSTVSTRRGPPKVRLKLRVDICSIMPSPETWSKKEEEGEIKENEGQLE